MTNAVPRELEVLLPEELRILIRRQGAWGPFGLSLPALCRIEHVDAPEVEERIKSLMRRLVPPFSELFTGSLVSVIRSSAFTIHEPVSSKAFVMGRGHVREVQGSNPLHVGLGLQVFLCGGKQMPAITAYHDIECRTRQ